MKFSPGDPVWAYTQGNLYARAGEHAAVVISSCPGDFMCPHSSESGYIIDILKIPCPISGKQWCSSEPFLRPRRDDYQQLEETISRDELNRVLEQAKVHGNHVKVLERETALNAHLEWIAKIKRFY